MTILQVQNIPDILYKRLEQRARIKKHSINTEVIQLLKLALDEVEVPTPKSVDQLLEEIQLHRWTPPDGTPDSTALLQEDRSR